MSLSEQNILDCSGEEIITSLTKEGSLKILFAAWSVQ